MYFLYKDEAHVVQNSVGVVKKSNLLLITLFPLFKKTKKQKLILK